MRSKLSFRLLASTALFAVLPSLSGAAPAGLARLTEVSCPAFHQQLASYDKQFAARMSDWSRKELGDLQRRDVLYLFSGPDVVTALALFPEAGHVTLVADQKPEYELLDRPEDSSPDKQARECSMIGFFSRLGYYRTNDLNGLGGPKPHFIKLLAYSVAFAGATIKDASAMVVGPNGELQPVAAGDARKPQGVRFEALRRDGRPVTVDYLVIDLANSGLRDANATAFLRRQNRDVLFLKSASHLLQSPHFSTLAGLLSSPAAPFLVQDETGFGVDRLHALYSLSRYGKFTTPQTLWKGNASARAFAEEFANNPSQGQLPFRIGYEKEAGSVLLVGRRTATPR